MTDYAPPSLPEYYDQLRRHDWLYQYSDDHRIWTASNREEHRLRNLAETSPAHKALYLAYRAYALDVPNRTLPRPPRPEE